MGEVTISMFYVIRYWILHYTLPDYVLSWEVCYVYFLYTSGSATEPELYLRFYQYVCVLYNGVWIDMFVYVIWSNCWLYFILGVLFYIATMYDLFFHCIIVTIKIVLICLWMLYLCLLRYVGVLHKICSLVFLHIGKLFMHIYFVWFVMPFSPYSLALFKKVD